MNLMFAIFFGIVGVLIILAVVGGVKHQQGFIAECMADGKKHYECEAMYQRTFVPQTVTVVK